MVCEDLGSMEWSVLCEGTLVCGGVGVALGATKGHLVKSKPGQGHLV